jgi:sugar phosphate isomerase/epimerase
MKKPRLGLQLYTLREALKEDYAGTMKKVAAAGYAGVEPAGFPGSTLEEAAGLYRDLGLAVCSAHTPLPVGGNREPVLHQMKTLGATRIVSGFGAEQFADEDAIRRTCDSFNEAAANAANAGMTFSIHNHWWEFELLGDRRVYEIMLDHLDASVCFEVDVYWVQTGGCNPGEVVAQLGERAPLLHIKDGPCVKKEPMTAVGEGKVDLEGISSAAKHVEWFIVELDRCATDMMAAVERSATYLLERGWAHGK